MENFGPNTVQTVTSAIPLIYDEHPVVDRPIIVPKGEIINRGDVLWLRKAATAIRNFTAGEDNVGDGLFQVDPGGDAQAESVTVTYDGATWDIVGTATGTVADQATGELNFSGFNITITDGDTAWEAGDTFSFDVVLTGNVVAQQPSSDSDLESAQGYGVAIAAKDVDATDEAVPSYAYVGGVFNINAIGNISDILGANEYYTIDDLVANLQDRGIYLKEGLK